MPPKHCCGIDFLKQLLAGDKLYFLNHEVPYVYVQKVGPLTVKNVMEKVYHLPEVRKYLPDYPEHPERYMNRDFLYSIVNKLDPTFFRRVSQEVNAQRKAKAEEVAPQSMQIRPDLLRVLQEAQSEVRTRESLGDARALKSMLVTKKKRKRAERIEVGGLNTEFMTKRTRT